MLPELWHKKLRAAQDGPSNLPVSLRGPSLMESNRPKEWICEEVNDVIDLAEQLAGAFGAEDPARRFMQEAVMLLLVKELKALRHHLEGQ